jgi:hypothetical protein
VRLREAGRDRILGWDLENRPSAYWYEGETTSQITAFGWKWTDEPDVHTLLLLRDGRFLFDGERRVSDSRAYGMFVGCLDEAGLVFGHNIRRHDLPMLNAGLLRRQMRPLRALQTSDTLKDYPRRGGMSASLENLAAMYGLDGEKKTMRQADWELANQLVPAGVELARERVVSDVLLQEQLRSKLLELGLLKTPRTWFP